MLRWSLQHGTPSAPERHLLAGVPAVSGRGPAEARRLGDYTGRALRALQELGFQLIIGAPREKATAFEDFVDLVAYISTDPGNPDGVRIYSMTIQEALQLDQDAA